MSALLQSYDPIVRVILQVLLNSLWQGLLIAMMVATILRLKSSMSATTRHAIWFVSLVAIGVLPFLTVSMGRVEQTQTVVVQQQVEQRLAFSTERPIATVDVKSEINKIEPLKSVARVKESQPLNRTSQTVENAVQPSAPIIDSASPTAQAVQVSPVKEAWISRVSGRILSGKTPLVIISLWLAVAAFMMFRILGSFGLMFRMRMNLKPIATRTATR